MYHHRWKACLKFATDNLEPGPKRYSARTLDSRGLPSTLGLNKRSIEHIIAWSVVTAGYCRLARYKRNDSCSAAGPKQTSVKSKYDEGNCLN